MTIDEQIQVFEDNLNEYGVCNITFEEFNYLKDRIKADAAKENQKQLSVKDIFNLGQEQMLRRIIKELDRWDMTKLGNLEQCGFIEAISVVEQVGRELIR